MNDFTDALSAAMNRAGLTQATLKARMRISQGTISAWMNGHRLPDLASFVRLCAALPELQLWLAARAYAFAVD